MEEGGEEGEGEKEKGEKEGEGEREGGKERGRRQVQRIGHMNTTTTQEAGIALLPLTMHPQFYTCMYIQAILTICSSLT